MSRIFLDTNLWIYLIEDQGPFGIRATEIIHALISRGDTLATSTLTLGEILVKPLRKGDLDLADRYRRAMRSPGMLLIPFDEKGAEIFARLRPDRETKPQDAIQLASAASVGCDLFITNDERLSRMAVPGIQFITSMNRAPI
ncbi:MAG TPA: PIN domain-containing protein [Acidobacteriaceae bacterium]|nr:PIN domain-containing protein [Acidobacteriaceae bacterium]